MAHKNKMFSYKAKGKGRGKRGGAGDRGGQREPGLTLGSCRPRAVAGNEDDAAQKLRNK